MLTTSGSGWAAPRQAVALNGTVMLTPRYPSSASSTRKLLQLTVERRRAGKQVVAHVEPEKLSGDRVERRSQGLVDAVADQRQPVGRGGAPSTASSRAEAVTSHDQASPAHSQRAVRGPLSGRAGRTPPCPARCAARRSAPPASRAPPATFRSTRRAAAGRSRATTRAARASWMTSSTVGGTATRGVTELDEPEPLRRQRRQLLQRRARAVEVQGVDEDPGVGPTDAGDDRGRGVEVADLHPRRELEVDGQPEVAGEVAEASEVVDRPAPIRIGKLADDVAGRRPPPPPRAARGSRLARPPVRDGRARRRGPRRRCRRAAPALARPSPDPPPTRRPARRPPPGSCAARRSRSRPRRRCRSDRGARRRAPSGRRARTGVGVIGTSDCRRTRRTAPPRSGGPPAIGVAHPRHVEVVLEARCSRW